MHARSIGACVALAAIMALAAGGSDVSTHRLDEYLQAARIALQPDAVTIDLELTPGVDVAESIISAIDTDTDTYSDRDRGRKRDGILSASEQQRYAERVARDLAISLDGTPVPLHVTSSTFSDADAFRRGEGTIRLQARAELPRVSTGTHRLSFKNAHLPGRSAYLANALLPENPRVSIAAQDRTSDQSELTIAYALRAEPPAARPGLLVGLAVAALLLMPLARKNI